MDLPDIAAKVFRVRRLLDELHVQIGIVPPRGCGVAAETFDAMLKRTVEFHRQNFDQRFPALRVVAMEYTLAGHLCLSSNGVAVMRELDRGLFSACVQYGFGTARGTLTRIGMAKLACGRTSDITRHFTAEPEPTRPPPLSLDHRRQRRAALEGIPGRAGVIRGRPRRHSGIRNEAAIHPDRRGAVPA